MFENLNKEIDEIFQQESVSALGCGIYRQDLSCLRPFEWLRTGTIAFLCAILQSQHPQLFPNLKSEQQHSPLKLCKIINPFISSMLILHGGQSFILETMQQQQLFSYRYLLMPSNTETSANGTGSHWFLMVYDTFQNQMWTMDSAYECVHANAKVMGHRLQEMRKMFNVAEQYRGRCQEMQAKGKINEDEKKELLDKVKERNFQVSWLKNTVKQNNNFDCGIHTVGNIELTLNLMSQKMQTLHQKQDTNQDLWLENQKINPLEIKKDPQFFRDLRIQYFAKALSTLKKCSKKSQVNK